MELIWSENAWEYYLWWQKQDKKTLKLINVLLKDIQRNGNEGIGKPEALRNNLSGCWSRRIADEDRLVYKIVCNSVRIATVRYHYS